MSDEAQVAVAEGVEPIEETQGSLLQTQEVSVERPEWLPEKFKSPEDLATAYNILEPKLGSSKEEALKAYQEKLVREYGPVCPHCNGMSHKTNLRVLDFSGPQISLHEGLLEKLIALSDGKLNPFDQRCWIYS